jgi:hypothetical protein
VLGDRHELDVGEADPLHMLDELWRDLAVAKRPVLLLGDAHPRAEVHLIDGHRGAAVGDLVALAAPGLIAPVVGEVPDDGGCLRRRLVAEGERVGLVDAVDAAGADDVVLVARSAGDPGHDRAPDPEIADARERGPLLVPAVPVADHVHRIGVRCPDEKLGAAGRHVRAELFVQARVFALVEQVGVELTEKGRVELVHGDLAMRVRSPPRGMATQSGRLLSS